MKGVNRNATLLAVAVVLSMLVPTTVGTADGSMVADDDGRKMSAADIERMKYININGFEFDPLQGVPDLPEGLRFDAEKTLGLAYYLVQFDRPITRSMKDGLSSTGATILQYVSYNAFIVRADRATIERAKDLPEVRWAGLFEPAYKLSPRLAQAYDQVVDDFLRMSSGLDTSVAAHTHEFDNLLSGTTRMPILDLIPDSGRGAISVEIAVFEEWNLPLVLDSIARIGGKEIRYSSQSSGIIRADMDRSSLPQIARELGVMWIDRNVPNVIYNDIARWVVQSGDSATFATPVHEHGIWGTGQIVTICDSGIDFQHNAFEDPEVSTPGPTHRKVTDYYVPSDAVGDDADQGGNHGTHTSATVAGDDGVWHVYDGNYMGSNGTSGPHDGIAFDATIHVQDVSDVPYYIYPPSDSHDMYQEALNRSSWIHSNSWGRGGADYDIAASQTDDFIWDNQDFLVIFAAANYGTFSNAMNCFATAKNVIAVGASENGAMMDNVADFSSRGPAEDGRIKPDVMAPGVDTWSALGGDPDGETDEYIQHSGTSMATPTVAGACALVRQYYMDGWYPTGTAQPANAFTPSAALVKATVINSAAEMTGIGAYEMGEDWYPNNNQGWGRVTLDDSLYFSGDDRVMAAFDERTGLSTGETATYEIVVGNTLEPLEITLVWSDYPGTAISNPNLVNDLDLVVRGPDGTVYLGNNYEGCDPGESVKNPDEHDRLNNVEGVLVLTDLRAGVWTIEVTAFNTPVGPQPYALVVTGEAVTDRGAVFMDRDVYQSDESVTIRVFDLGLDQDDESADSALVLLSSTTEYAPENITLVETGASTAVFEAIVPLDLSASPVLDDGILQVQNLDVISAGYYDDDDGLGGAGWVTDLASVDDDPPVISGVTVTSLRSKTCKIEWNTDEPSSSKVMYGTEMPLDLSLSSASLTTNHVLSLTRLIDNTTFYFAVESTDEAGNTAYDDNESAYYTFTTTPKPPTMPADPEWPTYQNNNARSGVSPSDLIPPLEQRWTTSQNGAYKSSPILLEGVLVSMTEDGIMAVDPYTGETLWNATISEQIDTYLRTPAAMDGVVYTCSCTFGDFWYESSVLAFDIQTGWLLWSVDLNSLGIEWFSSSNLVCDDGMLFAGDWDSVFALDIEDGSLIWHQTQAISTQGVSVANGLVYCSFDRAYALDELTGDIVWSSNLSDYAVGAPCITADAVYVLTQSGTLYAFDAFDGETIWSTDELGEMYSGTPVCDGDTLYLSSREGRVLAIDAFDGSILWEVRTESLMGTTMAYANGYLYRTSPYAGLVVHDAVDGAILHEYPLDELVLLPPVVSDGWVWVKDYRGALFGFRGLTPIGLQVTPVSQTVAGTPSSTVRFDIEVENIGYIGEDTFDIELTPGVRAWETGVFAADGETPLVDTDGDTIIDTGPIQPEGCLNVSILVSVPEDAVAGNSDITTLKLTSSSDANRSETISVTALVPLPGASIGPTFYAALDPGESTTATLYVRNDGGLPDTIDIETTSLNDWNLSLFGADGVTPLGDTDGDNIPDVGQVVGLEEVTIVVRLDAPVNPQGAQYEKVTVMAYSSLDPSASSSAEVLAELTAAPSLEWPTLRHDAARSGISPVDYELPLTLEWGFNLAGYTNGLSSPVISDRMVYCTDGYGSLIALDISSGSRVWSTKIGKVGYDLGTPSVSGELVYVTAASEDSKPTIFAVNKYTGDVQWSFVAGQENAYSQFCATVVALGNVYWVACESGQLRANDALTGDSIWTSPRNELAGGLGPSYGTGTVFYGDYLNGMTAYSALTGEVIWSREDIVSTAAPLVAGDVLYTISYDGSVLAINPSNGTTIWSAHVSDISITYCPLLVNGRLYVAMFDEYTYSSCMGALDASTGEILWTDNTSYDGLISSPAYSNGTIYAICEGYICAWDETTGETLATLPTAYRPTYSSVALGDGYLVASLADAILTYGFEGIHVAASAVASPDPLVLDIGEAKTVEVTAFDRYGNPTTEIDFEWESLSGLGIVHPMTENGEAVAYIAGTVAGNDTLRYTSGSMSATVEVEIRPGNATWVAIEPREVSLAPGETMNFSAVVRDEFGNERPNTDIVWSASEAAGTIDEDGSLVASTVVGIGMVVAELGNLSASATVTILPGELAAITASPQSATVTVGSSLTIEAAASDAFGNALSSVNMDWSSSTGTIIPMGDCNECAILVAPTYPGSVMVTVTSNELVANVAVQVVAGALDRIVLSPSPITIREGESVTIEALWEDSYGNDLEEEIMEWTHSIGDLTVSDDGLSAELHAGSVPGQGVVTASYDNVTESVTVTVLESEPRFSTIESILITSTIVAAVAAILIALFILRRRKGPSATDVSPLVEQPPTTSASEDRH